MIETLLAIVALFMAALAHLMVKFRQRVDFTATMAAQVLENTETASYRAHRVHDHDDWPTSATVQAGRRALFDLPHATCDAWTVAVLGAEHAYIEPILRQLVHRGYFAQRYQFAHVSAKSSGIGGDGAIAVADDILDFGSEAAAA